MKIPDVIRLYHTFSFYIPPYLMPARPRRCLDFGAPEKIEASFEIKISPIHFILRMSARREEVLGLVATALATNQPTDAYEQEIIDNFSEYIKHGQFASLSLPFLLKIIRKGRLKIEPDAICRLFVDSVPYNDYNSLQLLGVVNFRAVSTPALLQLREVATADGGTLSFPFIGELVQLRGDLEASKQCGGARHHDYDDDGVCKRCTGAKCIAGAGGLTETHNFLEDGRCGVCGAPRCRYDSLHVFNYDGHCHICGKAQPTRCEIVGCQTVGNAPNCSICGKPVAKATE
jgi:hypothetical protein